MRISYRQGLLSAQSDWLQISQLDAQYIDIIVNPTPVIAAIATGTKDYLISEQRTVTHAWGPFSGGLTQYLYWELDPHTGAISHSSTTLSPMQSASPPLVPSIGQMWWDSITNKMKVWTGVLWRETLRVLAGELQGGSNLVSAPFLSQVGLANPVNAGYLLVDEGGQPFRNNQGDLLTTDTPLTSFDTGSIVKLDGAQVTVKANERIPKFSAVYLLDGRAALASSQAPHNTTKAPVGIVTVDANQNDTINLVVAGREVYNDQWAWTSAQWGKAVYCTEFGVITLTKPLAHKNVRIGTIIGPKSILLSFDWETEIVLTEVGVSGVTANAPLAISGTVDFPVISIPKSTSLVDGYLAATDFARLPAIEAILPGKSDVGHIHPISDVTGLVSALAGKSDNGHSHAIADTTGLQDALDDKAALSHTHLQADITDLAPTLLAINNAISAKADKVVGATASNFAALDILGNLTDSGFTDADFALISHTHPLSDVVGLVLALSGKSDTGHAHAISDITGLQLALNDKSDVSHTHTILIADVTGLQTALNGKSSVTHTHALDDLSDVAISSATSLEVISFNDITSTWINKMLDVNDVSGLQTALNGKAPTVHSHVIADTTGLQLALNSKADVVHTHTLAASLTDVDIVTIPPVNGNVLKFDGTKWIAGVGGGAGASNLYELLDVDFVTVPPIAGNVLEYNGTDWVPGSAAGAGTLVGLTDVQNWGPADGDILKYNSTLLKWETVDPDATVSVFGFSLYETTSLYDGNASSTWTYVTPWQVFAGAGKVDWVSNALVFNKVGTYKITVQAKISPGSGTSSLLPDEVICGTGISIASGGMTILSEDRHVHYKNSNSTSRLNASYHPLSGGLYETYSFTDVYAVSTMSVGDSINVYSHVYDYIERTLGSTVTVSLQVFVQQISNFASMPV